MARTLKGAPAPSNDPQIHSLIATLNGTYDPQNDSVFFTIIPPEIRNNIFSLALYSYDDKSHPYPDDSYYSRPGYRYRSRIDTALLATCKRIYTETHDLPVSQNEHVFWCSSSRGPPRAFCDNPAGYFERFTKEQKAAVVHVHLFTQLFWLEDGPFQVACKHSVGMPTKHMKITIRHADWWFWERNTPLALKSHWGNDLKFVKGLESLEVELETIERDKAQLETITKNMLRWRFPLADDRFLTTEGNPIRSERYLGQSVYSESSGQHPICFSTVHNHWISGRPLNPATLAYVSSTLRWTAKASNK